MNDTWLNKINWSQDGLVPAVTQDAASGRVLTVAWMNREALKQTAATGEVHDYMRAPAMAK
jgi:phosphoribosyl-AMP cyclohydrolase